MSCNVTKLAHLQVALQQQHPPTFTACLQSVLTAIPPPWRAVVTAAPTAPTWQQGLSAAGSQLIQNTQTIQDVLLALAFLACGGHHILLGLLSLHLCNEYLSLPKKKKKKKGHPDRSASLTELS